MKREKYEIGIIGAGGWGTALSTVISKNNHKVTVWSHEIETAEEIINNHINSVYLPDVELPITIYSTNNINELTKLEYYILAVPVQFIRNVILQFKPILKNKPIINVAKGIETSTQLRVSEIVTDVLGDGQNDYAIITGPSHAEEVAREMPTAVVCATKNPELATQVQSLLSNDFFRVYTSDDVIGCEIGGSVKNIIAIAAGIIDGLGLGDNTKAALVTRGLAEISRFGAALGANPSTFSGLSGLGDLFVTCNSRHSRNRRVGELIGKGITLGEILKDMKMIAEGIQTTSSALELGKKLDIELPITEQVFEILFHNKQPLDAIKELMSRKPKEENQ